MCGSQISVYISLKAANLVGHAMRASQEMRLIEDGLTTSKSVAEVSVLMKDGELIRCNPVAVAFITRRQCFERRRSILVTASADCACRRTLKSRRWGTAVGTPAQFLPRLRAVMPGEGH